MQAPKRRSRLLPRPRALGQALAAWRMSREGPIADGRELGLVDYVLAEADQGDADGVIAAIDRYCYTRCVMMNVGEEKGELLERAVRRARPELALELGTYCGYSAIRIGRALPEHGRLATLEREPERARLAAQLIDHAGLADRVAVVVGDVGDGGATLERLRREQRLVPGSVGFLFIDHDKSAYLPHLELVLSAGLLAVGATVVADNVLIPGAPDYRAYMRREQGRRFDTRAHRTHLEYQRLIPDLMLESTYLGEPPTSAQP